MDLHRGTENTERMKGERASARHTYPGRLRMSGRERGYATGSAQEWQTKDLQRDVFAFWRTRERGRGDGRWPAGGGGVFPRRRDSGRRFANGARSKRSRLILVRAESERNWPEGQK